MFACNATRYCSKTLSRAAITARWDKVSLPWISDGPVLISIINLVIIPPIVGSSEASGLAPGLAADTFVVCFTVCADFAGVDGFFAAALVTGSTATGCQSKRIYLHMQQHTSATAGDVSGSTVESESSFRGSPRYVRTAYAAPAAGAAPSPCSCLRALSFINRRSDLCLPSTATSKCCQTATVN